ncbi:acyl-CoA thioesterase II [Mesorhizobium sp. M0590]|uniref:acyl-CoA thioesterase n=1 Tax=Mesorhizobium sp. M0590 TaxID=2956966 RepID=UPI0033365918
MLEPELVKTDQFRGISLDLGFGYVFGGQLVAQALAAAEQTVQVDQAAHSVHGHFLRPGNACEPIIYQVDRIRDGKRFATRRVDATQDGRTIFTMTASFQSEETGFEHQSPKPRIPGPGGLLSQAEIAGQYKDSLPEAGLWHLSFERAIEIRPVDPVDIFHPQAKPALSRVWYRALDKLSERPAVHRYLLAYISDMHMQSAAMQPHALTWNTSGLQTSSLDHAIWFHRPLRIDEWLLHVMDSPSASGARGLTRGQFFTQDGRLVASTMQEGLMRLRP